MFTDKLKHFSSYFMVFLKKSWETLLFLKVVSMTLIMSVLLVERRRYQNTSNNWFKIIQ